MLTDAYNFGHQYLKVNTDFEVSHFYNRTEPMVLFGFREMVQTYLSIQITADMIVEAHEHANKMGCPFPTEIFYNVVNNCDGYFPLQVDAVADGTWVPAGTPFAQIKNTLLGFGELVTWFEAVFMHAYFASACATRAFKMRNYINLLFGNKSETAKWRFHSFGFRGHKSLEDAYWAGMAWSMFLPGTDDAHISLHLKNTTQIGSILALAHKVTQQYDNETNCFVNAVDIASKTKRNIVALVIDTYNADNVIQNMVEPVTKYAKNLGVHCVWRPDSGDLFQQTRDILFILEQAGLDNGSVIIGEGMSFDEAKKMDERLFASGCNISKVSYGIGAGFYKDIERDTLGWAMKTAFSNKKNRMKLVESCELKQSIPGEIVLLRHRQTGQVVVAYKEDSYLNDGSYVNIFDRIYSSNSPSTTVSPYFAPQENIPEIRDRAYATEASGRLPLVLSEMIKEEIKSFKIKYSAKQS